MIEIHHHPSRRELRQFAAIWLPATCGLVGGWVLYKFGSVPAAAAIWTIAAVVSLVGLLLPAFMRPIFVGWLYAALPIGWTISHLVLAIIYYLLVTPTGLVLRLLGHDPLGRKRDPSAASYWVPRAADDDISRYFRQF